MNQLFALLHHNAISNKEVLLKQICSKLIYLDNMSKAFIGNSVFLSIQHSCILSTMTWYVAHVKQV
jgi:hypothetical protein